MCGIAGIYSIDPQEHSVRRMIDVLRHRGPDEAAFWSDRSVALGHCRLAIIDPERGRQPMTLYRPDGSSVVVCFGGEVYNYPKIRENLEALGRSFRTASDTEVVGQAYMEWGADAFNRFRGMFALAIWDDRRRELVLCRDHLGIKPLYFHSAPNSIVFASEIRALIVNTPRVQMNREGTCELLGMWPYRSPQAGIIRGIDELMPGTYMTIGPAGTKVVQYWKLAARDHTDSLIDTADRVRSLLGDSVHEQLRSDSALTALVSGGLDSSAILALAAQHWQRPESIHAFTLELPDSAAEFVPSAFRPELDLPFALLIGERVGAEMSRVGLSDQDIIDGEASTTLARDMPDNGDLDTTLAALFSHVAKRYKVCLTGEGADELFGGYPWSDSTNADDQWSFPWLKSLCFPSEFITSSLRRVVRDYQHSAYSIAVSQMPDCADGGNSLNVRDRLQSYLDIAWFLPAQLERMDRISMWNGVEARVPFCFPEMAEYCWNIPHGWKRYGDIEKGLLRLAMNDVLPEVILRRRKTSYPTANGRKYEEHLRESVELMIGDVDWQLRPLIDVAAVANALEGRGPRPTARPSIWLGQLWSMYRWSKHYNVEYVP